MVESRFFILQEADGAAPAEGKMRTLPPTELLGQLPPLQKLLERLMDTMPRGAAARHYVVQAALLTVAKESFQVWHTLRVYAKVHVRAAARLSVIIMTLTKVIEVLCVCCTTDSSVSVHCWLSCVSVRHLFLRIPVLLYCSAFEVRSDLCSLLVGS